MRINPKRLFLFPTVLFILTGSFVFLSASEPILLNEYNAVGGSKFLKDDKSDSTLGRIEGNGGNWIEFVVTTDHADIRGLQLRWAEEAGAAPAETLWDPDPTNANRTAPARSYSSRNRSTMPGLLPAWRVQSIARTFRAPRLLSCQRLGTHRSGLPNPFRADPR